MKFKRGFKALAFIIFLFTALGLLAGCSTQSEELLLELSDSQPSLLLFYTDD